MAATAAGLLLCAHGAIPVGGPAQRVGYLDVCERCLELLFPFSFLVIICRFPAEFVRCTAQGWFRGTRSYPPGFQA